MNNNSRFIKGGTVEDTSKPGFWVRNVFPKAADDLTITITDKYKNKPYLIAYDLYGTVELGWFVLQYNDILDSTAELVPGAVIQLPTPKRLNIGMI